MNSSTMAEVLVVGAGPAGSVTAGLLARRGHDVLLVDRATFPRSKPCGESLNPGAVRELAAIGALEGVLALPHEVIRRWRVQPLHGTPFEGEFEESTYGVAVDRGDLDATLLQFARRSGARVATGCHVTEVLKEEGAVTGVRDGEGREMRARLFVGADGLRSVVVRRLGLLRRGPRLRKLALTAHVRAPDLPSQTGILCITRWGCIGVASLRDDLANVVVVLDNAASSLASGDRNGCFDRLIAGNEYLRGAVRSCDVKASGPFDWPTRSVVTDRAILVGDAAGYFDPLTGQGIYRAIRGARLVAETVSPLLFEGRLTKRDLMAYERLHDREFAAGERVQRLIEIGVAHPPLFSAAGALLRANPGWANRVLAATGDVNPARSAFRRPASLGRAELRPTD